MSDRAKLIAAVQKASRAGGIQCGKEQCGQCVDAVLEKNRETCFKAGFKQARLYTSKNFAGPFQEDSAVVVAESRVQAAKFLELKLAAMGLKQIINPDSMKELTVKVGQIRILADGEY